MKKYDPELVAKFDAFLETLKPREVDEIYRIGHNRHRIKIRKPERDANAAYFRKLYRESPDVRQRQHEYYENVTKIKRAQKRVQDYIKKKGQEDDS
ncbi:MAG: hypothetical protein IKY59_03590 [Oscillospiraceae bacterium]|nr:hypothetical protein [Oscillospiraceae bacterium]